MQIRDAGALTHDGCREVPVASLARTQNGCGAGLGRCACAAVPCDRGAAGERRYRTQVGGAERLSRLIAGPSLSPCL